MISVFPLIINWTKSNKNIPSQSHSCCRFPLERQKDHIVCLTVPVEHVYAAAVLSPGVVVVVPSAVPVQLSVDERFNRLMDVVVGETEQTRNTQTLKRTETYPINFVLQE